MDTEVERERVEEGGGEFEGVAAGNEETERLAADLGMEVWFPSAELRTRVEVSDSRLEMANVLLGVPPRLFEPPASSDDINAQSPGA